MIKKKKSEEAELVTEKEVWCKYRSRKDMADLADVYLWKLAEKTCIQVWKWGVRKMKPLPKTQRGSDASF